MGRQSIQGRLEFAIIIGVEVPDGGADRGSQNGYVVATGRQIGMAKISPRGRGEQSFLDESFPGKRFPCRICPILSVPKLSEFVRMCPNLSEIVRMCPNLSDNDFIFLWREQKFRNRIRQIRTHSDTFGQVRQDRPDRSR